MVIKCSPGADVDIKFNKLTGCVQTFVLDVNRIKPPEKYPKRIIYIVLQFYTIVKGVVGP